MRMHRGYKPFNLISQTISGSTRWPKPSRLQSYSVEAKPELKQILDNFDAPVSFAFGYGSGVFSQGPKTRVAGTQIDLILAVDDPTAWHRINIEQHPKHYSSLKHLGPGAVEFVQNLGAGVYFNPLVSMHSTLVKYGVVSTSMLSKDLKNWNSLYLAGRMHKPISVLKPHADIEADMETNLKSALSLALLMMPKDFTEKQLYQTVTSLSYMGDIRMMFAENPNKVRNIVENQFDLFRELYKAPALDCGIELALSPGGEQITQAPIGNQGALLNNLPSTIRRLLPSDANTLSKKDIAVAVRSIVRGPAFEQTVKGFFSAGVIKSCAYTFEKLRKRWQK